MKKTIGILGVAIIALAMFMNTSSINNNSDLNLTSLLALNTANAEDANLNDSIWEITYTVGTTTTYSCKTGGSYVCNPF